MKNEPICKFCGGTGRNPMAPTLAACPNCWGRGTIADQTEEDDADEPIIAHHDPDATPLQTEFHDRFTPTQPPDEEPK